MFCILVLFFWSLSGYKVWLNFLMRKNVSLRNNAQKFQKSYFRKFKIICSGSAALPLISLCQYNFANCRKKKILKISNYLKITESDRKSSSCSFVEKSWKQTFDLELRKNDEIFFVIMNFTKNQDFPNNKNFNKIF